MKNCCEFSWALRAPLALNSYIDIC